MPSSFIPAAHYSPPVPTLSASVPVEVSRDGLPFEVFLARPSPTASIWVPLRSAIAGSKQAMTNTRLRRWGTPKNCASRTAHSMKLGPNPAISLRTASKSSPPRLDKAPTTFSQIAHRGKVPAVASRISLMIRVASKNNPLRLPSNPARLPATDKSWHGDPNVMTSTGGRSAPLTVATSPQRGTVGQWWARVCWQCGSHSTCHPHSHPAASSPRSKPPTPANRLPNRIRRRRRQTLPADRKPASPSPTPARTGQQPPTSNAATARLRQR